MGPVATVDGGSIEALTVTDSIVQGAYLADGVQKALSIATGLTVLARVTVLGPAAVHRLEASECVLHDVTTVTDLQRVCAVQCLFHGQRASRRYECHGLAPRAPLFVSRRLGNPGTPLLDSAGPAVREGGRGRVGGGGVLPRKGGDQGAEFVAQAPGIHAYRARARGGSRDVTAMPALPPGDDGRARRACPRLHRG